MLSFVRAAYLDGAVGLLQLRPFVPWQNTDLHDVGECGSVRVFLGGRCIRFIDQS
jgi:hypothetical protein